MFAFLGKKLKREAIDVFLEDLERKGIDIKVLDRKSIAKRYGRGLLESLKKSLIRIKIAAGFNKFLLIYQEKEKRRIWYSDLGRVVINLAYSPIGPEFEQELQKTTNEAQKLEEYFKKEKTVI